MPVAKEQIRQNIAGNNISSVADVYTLLRDSFKDTQPCGLCGVRHYDRRNLIVAGRSW